MSWGYVAVAAATVISGAISADSSRKAARSERKSAEAALEEQKRQSAETEARLDPFASQGLVALEQQGVLAGLQGMEAQQEAFQALSDSPGQQFLRDQQERALLRNAAAIGGLGGGNIRTALQQQAFGRAQTDIANQFNRLASISGAGQTATQSIGQLGALAAGNIGQLQQAAGAARASGILGQSQAQRQTIGGLAGLAAQGGALSQQQQPPQQTTTPAVNQPQSFQA